MEKKQSEKRVLHLVDTLGLGGAQTVLKSFFEEQKENDGIFLFALRSRKTTMKVDHPNVRIMPSLRKYSFIPLFELYRLIKKEQVNVLHCHLFRSHVFGWLLKKIFFPQVKLVFHEHGQIFRGNFYYNSFMRWTCSRVDLFLVVSENTQKKLLEITNVAKERVEVVYNFVDLEKFEERKESKVKNVFTIGFVGRLNKIKRVDLLIEAFSIFNKKNKRTKLLIVGSGPEELNLKEQVSALSLEEKVQFLGYQKEPENFYQKFNILVLCSESEACPMTLFEAMASGVPVIGSDIEQIREFLAPPRRGLSFKSGNAIDLANEIKKLSNDKELRNKILKAGLGFSKKNSLESYIAKLDKIYKRL